MNKKTLVLASDNTGKLREFEQLFAQLMLPINVVCQATFNIPKVAETGLSFVENALIKARHASKNSNGLAALADDSGLSVPLLDGAPGVYSARYAGEPCNDAANNTKLLETLKPYRASGRIDATFICVLAFVRHPLDPLPIICQGVWHGEIAESLHGTQGFGYDPIFWLPQLGQTSAVLSKAQKNAISHRAQAMAQLGAQLTAEWGS